MKIRYVRNEHTSMLTMPSKAMFESRIQFGSLPNEWFTKDIYNNKNKQRGGGGKGSYLSRQQTKIL